MGPLRGFVNDMAALHAKEEAQHWQSTGAFEKALPLMLESVSLRERSHTLCLSLSELAELYLDMHDFDKAEATVRRMLGEARRYDEQQQMRIADEIMQDVVKERLSGMVHGDSIKITGQGLPQVFGEMGILRGKVRGRDEYYIDIGSKRHVLSRRCFEKAGA